mgnify:CR=1 FL=1
MQKAVNSGVRDLTTLKRGESGILDRIDLPEAREAWTKYKPKFKRRGIELRGVAWRHCSDAL